MAQSPKDMRLHGRLVFGGMFAGTGLWTKLRAAPGGNRGAKKED